MYELIIYFRSRCILLEGADNTAVDGNKLNSSTEHRCQLGIEDTQHSVISQNLQTKYHGFRLVMDGSPNL